MNRNKEGKLGRKDQKRQWLESLGGVVSLRGYFMARNACHIKSKAARGRELRVAFRRIRFVIAACKHFQSQCGGSAATAKTNIPMMLESSNVLKIEI
jgi:hypothetical protein